MLKCSLRRFFLWYSLGIVVLALVAASPCGRSHARAAESKPSWLVEWERVLEAARKEGKIVAGIPASAELRKKIEQVFKSRFPGIELELLPSRGSVNVNRIISEQKADIRYFDLLISGTSTPFALLNPVLVEPFEPLMILPEVKDPKRWYGGHIWLDSTKRFIYSFQAYQSENLWHNESMMKPDEIRSYDDLLHPKWRGKIGYLDPRTPGAGTATWAFLWKLKGEGYLRKLVGQELLLSRDQRQLAESLAKGNIALTVGLTYYSFLPFIKAGLPLKPLPEPTEGTYTSCGSGALSVIKNAPHPNALKLFVNWLLSKEGQEIYGKAMGQATRRLDVDTKWLTKFSIRASKDFLTVEENNRLENYGEDTVTEVWGKGTKFAQEILK